MACSYLIEGRSISKQTLDERLQLQAYRFLTSFWLFFWSSKHFRVVSPACTLSSSERHANLTSKLLSSIALAQWLHSFSVSWIKISDRRSSAYSLTSVCSEWRVLQYTIAFDGYIPMTITFSCLVTSTTLIFNQIEWLAKRRSLPEWTSKQRLW